MQADRVAEHARLGGVGDVVRQFGGPLLLFGGSLALALLSTRELWDGGMVAFGDLPRFPTEPSAFADRLWDAWSVRGLGGPFTSTTGVLLAATLVALSGGQAELAQQLYMTLWIPVAFCGMAYLCRRSIQTSWLLAATGGLVYVATPVSIGLVVGGAAGLIWAYALAPLMIIGAEKLQRGGLSAIAWFALAVALLAAFTPELVLFGLLVLVVWILTGHERKRLALTGGVAFVLAALAALPSVVGRGGVRLSSGLLEKVGYDFQYTYAELTPQTLARFAGNKGDPMHPLGYNGEALWTYVGYLPLAALVLGLVLRRKGDRFPIKVGLLAAFASAILFLIAILVRTAPSALLELSPILAFRNPGKPMILFTAAVVPGAIYGVQRLFEVLPHRRRALSAGVVLAVFAYLGLYATPALTGHWGVETVRGSFEAKDDLYAPAQYLERRDRALEGRWRVVWLPFDANDVLNLEWVLPQWANDPVLESRDPEIEDTTAMLQDALDAGNMRRFHFVADRAAVRYVVVRAAADPAIRPAFAKDRELKPIHRGRGYEIWRNAAALPRIRQFSALTAVMVPERLRPVEYVSPPLLTTRTNPLSRGTRWRIHPGRNFRREGSATRIPGTQSDYWPVIYRRFRADAETDYIISARVRTKNAAGAHVKVVWYRREGDPEIRALDHDYADPPLTGDHRWTHVAGVVESPPGTRFGELQFLAGQRPVGSSRNAVSWVQDLQIANYYRGDAPEKPVEAMASVIPEVKRRSRELVEADSLAAALAERDLERLSVDAVLINPRFHGRRSSAFRAITRLPGQVEIAARAEVALQPRRGQWRKRSGVVEVVSRRGEASVPLGLVEPGRYVIDVTGCRIPPRSIQIVLPTRTLQPRFSSPPRNCGRWRTTEPVALQGRAVLRLSVRRGVSIASVRAGPVEPRQLASTGSPLRITRASTPSPGVHGASAPGLTLADAFHPGWHTSGATAGHFRTVLGFNGFLIDDPARLSGLTYEPQTMRVVLLALSGFSWAAMVGLLVVGLASKRVNWLFYEPKH